jgi:tetratricopeptide (TPR) repeat protein
LGVALALALVKTGRAAEGEGVMRDLVGRQPNNPEVHLFLGYALGEQKKLGEAVGSYRKAIALDPRHALAHYNLAHALKGQGEVEGAIECCRKAIEIDPKLAVAHINLGNALKGKKDLEGAIECYRQAIEVDPKLALAHYNLGFALTAKGDAEGAIACYKKAIDVGPKDAAAHYNLGNALTAKGDVEGAIACYQKAIAADPNHAEAHCNLGQALSHRGSFREGLRYLKAGHQLGSRRKDWPYPSDAWVQQAERLVELDAKLLEILSGKTKPKDAGERLDLAWVALRPSKGQYAAAARLYAEGFAAKGVRADLLARHRYNAACASALAAAGKGEGAAKLTDKERARLRGQALYWLTADLTAWSKLAAAPAEQRLDARQTLTRWRADPDLTGVRDKDALAELPEDERAKWQELWGEVDGLLKHVGDKK